MHQHEISEYANILYMDLLVEGKMERDRKRDTHPVRQVQISDRDNCWVWNELTACEFFSDELDQLRRGQNRPQLLAQRSQRSGDTAQRYRLAQDQRLVQSLQ